LFALLKIANAKQEELGLDKKQQGFIGEIIKELYKEKRGGQGNYKNILEAAIRNDEVDFDVQKVIFAMMQALEA
jgi:hypothetical protein